MSIPGFGFGDVIPRAAACFDWVTMSETWRTDMSSYDPNPLVTKFPSNGGTIESFNFISEVPVIGARMIWKSMLTLALVKIFSVDPETGNIVDEGNIVDPWDTGFWPTHQDQLMQSGGRIFWLEWPAPLDSADEWAAWLRKLDPL